jgi:hypothetical protein
MEKTQLAKLGMFKAVLTHCRKNEHLMKFNAVLTEVYHTLGQRIADIGMVMQSQQRIITGIVLEKMYAREALTADILMLTKMLYTLATRTGNMVMLKEMSSSASKLKRMKDDTFTTYCMNTLKVASVHLAALNNYNISEESLKEIGEKVTAFSEASPQPRNAVSQRAANRKALDLLIREINALLKNQLDILVSPFKISEPEFYNAYKSNRKTLSLTGTTTQLKGTILLSGTKKPITGVEIQVWDGGTEPVAIALSNVKGNYRIAGITPGFSTIKVRDEKGNEKVVKDFDMNMGKVNRLDFSL